MPYWCPNTSCHAEIEELLYNSNVNEWGNYDIENGDHNQSDSETQDTNYECPECNHNLDSEDVLTENPNEDEEEEEEEAPTPQTALIKAEAATTVKSFFNQEAFTRKDRPGTVEVVKCDKCSHLFSVCHDDLANLRCTNCSRVIKAKETIKI